MADGKVVDEVEKFSKAEKVLCYEPDSAKVKVLYDSKVLAVYQERDTNEKIYYEYKIHFQGWNRSYDRRLGAEFLLKDNGENRKLQRELAEEAELQIGGYAYKAPATSSATKNSKKRRTGIADDSAQPTGGEDQASPTKSAAAATTTEESAASSSTMGRTRNTSGRAQRPNVTRGLGTGKQTISDLVYKHHHIIDHTDRVLLLISERLRKILEYDYNMIVMEEKCHALPANRNIVDILEDFLKLCAVELVLSIQQPSSRQRSTAQNNEKMEREYDRVMGTVCLMKEVVDGIRIYFNFLFKKCLIYKEERCHAEPYANKEYLRDFERKYEKKPWQLNMESGIQTNDGITVKVGSPAYKAELRHYVTIIKNTPHSKVKNAYAAAEFITKDMHKYLMEIFSWKLLPADVGSEITMVFGASHLARLMINLPKRLSCSGMSDTKLEALVPHLETFVRYLESNEDWFGDHVYEGYVKVPFSMSVRGKKKNKKKKSVDEKPLSADEKPLSANDKPLSADEKPLPADMKEVQPSEKKHRNRKKRLIRVEGKVYCLDKNQQIPENIAAIAEKNKLQPIVGLKKWPLDKNNKLIIPTPSEMKEAAEKEEVNKEKVTGTNVNEARKIQDTKKATTTAIKAEELNPEKPKSSKAPKKIMESNAPKNPMDPFSLEKPKKKKDSNAPNKIKDPIASKKTEPMASTSKEASENTKGLDISMKTKDPLASSTMNMEDKVTKKKRKKGKKKSRKENKNEDIVTENDTTSSTTSTRSSIDTADNVDEKDDITIIAAEVHQKEDKVMEEENIIEITRIIETITVTSTKKTNLLNSNENAQVEVGEGEGESAVNNITENIDKQQIPSATNSNDNSGADDNGDNKEEPLENDDIIITIVNDDDMEFIDDTDNLLIDESSTDANIITINVVTTATNNDATTGPLLIEDKDEAMEMSVDEIHSQSDAATNTDLSVDAATNTVLSVDAATSTEEEFGGDEVMNDSLEIGNEVVINDSTEEMNIEVMMNDSTEIANEVVINDSTDTIVEMMEIETTEELVVEDVAVDLQQEFHQLLESGDVAETVEIS